MLARSKLTSQCQISVPAKVRQRLGLGPGSLIEWLAGDGCVTVRRAGGTTFEDVRRALFPEGPPKRKTDRELRQGIERYIKDQHARGRY